MRNRAGVVVRTVRRPDVRIGSEVVGRVEQRIWRGRQGNDRLVRLACEIRQELLTGISYFRYLKNQEKQ